MAFFHKGQLTRDRSRDYIYNRIAKCLAVCAVSCVLCGVAGLTMSKTFKKGDTAYVVGSDVKVTIVRAYLFNQFLVIYADRNGAVHEQVFNATSLRSTP